MQLSDIVIITVIWQLIINQVFTDINVKSNLLSLPEKNKWKSLFI